MIYEVYSYSPLVHPFRTFIGNFLWSGRGNYFMQMNRRDAIKRKYLLLNVKAAKMDFMLI